MTKNTKLSFYLLTLVFLLALFLRLYRLNLNSPSLYADEVGQYFILNNIKNHSFGFLKTFVQIIFTSTWYLGLNPLGVRFSSAILSSFLVVLGFFFAKTVSKSSGDKLYLRVAIIFSFLMAILPWGISIGRIGHTHIPILLILVLLHLTIYIDAKSLRSKVFSFVPLILSAYFYPSVIVMSPLILIQPAIDYFSGIKINKTQILLITSLIIFIFSLFLVKRYQIFNSHSRGLDLAIWKDVNVTADANLYRGLARLSPPSIFSFGQDPEKLANKLVYNYPISVLSVFTRNYLSFFSIDFLFLKGDIVLRHSTGMVGNFYLYLLPFIVFGSFIFFRVQSSKNKIIFLTWILASPIPAAITKDGSTYLLRAITLMPFLTYFAAYGIVVSFESLKNNMFKVLFALAISFATLFSAYYYFYGYFHVYPALAADSFEYGFKELAQFQLSNPGKMLIVWDDKYPLNYFCFWQNLSFSICKSDNTQKNTILGKTRVDQPLPEVIFTLPKQSSDLDLIIKNYKPRYIVVPKKYSEDFLSSTIKFKLLDSVNNPDLTVAFKIYEI